MNLYRRWPRGDGLPEGAFLIYKESNRNNISVARASRRLRLRVQPDAEVCFRAIDFKPGRVCGMSNPHKDTTSRSERLHRPGVASAGGPQKRTGPHFLVTPATMHPLRFEPIIKKLIWGGSRLGSVLRKPIGEGSQYAESWELSDHRTDVSVVAEGPLAGMTLRDLVRYRTEEVLGPALSHLGQFPLLVKYIDAEHVLSVQVHPDDELARRLADDNGKTETWVVIAAEPDSVIYAGLKEGVTREAFAAAIAQGEVEHLLHKIPARVGDCILIRAGIVHAIGSGVMIAEIQQMSDTTFRVFDWNRLGIDNKPRQLHVEQALESTDFSAMDQGLLIRL